MESGTPWVLALFPVVGVGVLVVLVVFVVLVVRSVTRGVGIRPQRNRHGGSFGNGGTGLP